MRPCSPLARRALLLALTVLCVGASFSRADDDDKIPKDQFLQHANEQFDQMAANYPHYQEQIQKTRQYFNDKSAKAFEKKDKFDPWENNYVRRSLRTTLNGMQNQLDIMDTARRENWDHDRMMSALKENKDQTAAKQQVNETRAAFESRGATAEDSAKMAMAGPKGPPPDFKDSPVFKLQNEAIRYGFPKPQPPPR